MSIRRKTPSGPEPLPTIEPMEEEMIPAIVREFCDRHSSRPDLGIRQDERGAVFTLGELPVPTIFAFEMDHRSVRVTSGVEFEHGPEGRERLNAAIAEISPDLAFGALQVTDEGVQWHWDAPAIHYPYFHGFTEHAIAYAEFHSLFLWPVLRAVSEGALTVEEAVEHLRQPPLE